VRHGDGDVCSVIGRLPRHRAEIEQLPRQLLRVLGRPEKRNGLEQLQTSPSGIGVTLTCLAGDEL
jgi:hypothetical protein